MLIQNEANTITQQRTYWGVLCRTCGKFVGFDIVPSAWFECSGANVKPGAIRCAHGHNHIYFPQDFSSYPSTTPITDDTAMEENRASYSRVNPLGNMS